MIKLLLAASVAALALTSAPASAQQGPDRGQKGAKAQRGDDERKAARAERRAPQRQAQRAERRAPERQAQRVERRAPERQAQRVERRAPERQAQRVERRAPERQAQRIERRAPERKAERVERRAPERQAQRAERRASERQAQRVERRAPDRVVRERAANRIEARRDDRRKANRIEARRDDRRDAARVANRIEARRDDRRDANRVNRIDARRDALRRSDVRFANRIDQRNDRRDGWIDSRNDRRNDRFDDRRFAQRASARGWIDGCPPGLRLKNNNCLAPGQAKLVGQYIPAAYRAQVVPDRLRVIYRDTPDYYYRYGDGYMYRVNRRDNLVAALLPLLGAGYGIGQAFPSSYMNSYVPNYYSSFYPDSSDNYYRYANGYVYGIDPYSGLIQDTIPAYGYGYGVGQMWPSSYSYYNVPDQYRGMYYDTDDYYYRYAPGSIYQVDRSSSLITAVAALLTGGMSIGQPLPLGYDAYNVPYAYRDQFYDTDDSWYRYSNGNIYQVDPTTRLVSAIVQAIV